jgi:hypothetical protein
VIWHGGRPRLQPGTALLVKPEDLLAALDLLEEAGLRGRERSALLALLALAKPSTGMVYESNTEIMRLAGYASTSSFGSGHAHGTLQRLQKLGLIARAVDSKRRTGWLLNPGLASRPSGPGLQQQRWAEFQLWQPPLESPAGMRADMEAKRLRDADWRQKRMARLRQQQATTEPLPAAA